MMRKILFALSFATWLTACGGGTQSDQELNAKLEKEHQDFVKEHDAWQQENIARERDYDNWSKRYDSLKLKKDTTVVYDTHEELKKQHAEHVANRKKLLDYDEKFLKAHTALIKSHKDGKINDKDFQAKHDTLAVRHKQMLDVHEAMKKRHKMFEEQQTIEMDLAKKKQAEKK
jgi:hypothetical protein